VSVKEVSPELLADAGLSEKEIQVYLTVLGLGNSTLGQISQITGIDIFETQELLAQLESVHYVKKLPGILSRYIPMEPFLQALGDIDKRFQVEMAQLKDVFTKNIGDFIINIDKTYGNLSNIFELAQDRVKAPQIISTTDDSLIELFNAQKSNYVSVKDKGTELLKQSISSLSDKLMKEIGERQGLVGQITHGAIDASKSSVEASRHALSSSSADLTSSLRVVVEGLKSNLFSILEQHVDSHDRLTQTILQEVDRIVEKYQTEFARSSTFLKEDFTRIVDNQNEIITKNHETLQSTLRDVYDDISKEWEQTTRQVQPEFDQVNKSLSEFEQRLKTLGDEIRTFQTGFRKPFPQEEMAAKAETLAADLTTFVTETKSIIEKVNTPIEKALSGSQTMIQKTDGIITEVTAKTKEELESLKTDASERIEGTLRDFKSELVEENQEKLNEYFSNVNKTVTGSKENVSSELAGHMQTQTEHIQRFLSTADTQHSNAINQVDQELNRVRKEVEAILTEHGRVIQGLFQEKQTEIATNLGVHLDEFHTKTDNCHMEIMNQLKSRLEEQTGTLKTSVNQIQEAIGPVITQVKDIAQKMEREAGEKIVAVTMRTAAVEKAISRVQEESSQIRPVITAKTWALLGKQNLPSLINDMLTRTKSSITLVLPELSGALLNRIAELPQTRKITLVSEIDVDQFELELGQLLDQGNVQLRHYAKKDINMCIRDAEEAFLALEAPEEEFVTILTESEQLVQLLYKIMSSEFVSIAKPVKF